jgi:hypothetical protein
MPEIPRPTFTKNNRADGVFASCTHPNSPVSGSAFAKRLGETEIAIDRPEERERTSRRIDAFASAPPASSAMTEVGQADQIGTTGVVADVHGPVAPDVSGSMVADAAGGADSLFPSCTYPDHPAPSADTTKHNVDARCSQERLRATRAEL